MEVFKNIKRSVFLRIMKIYRGQPWQRVITSARTRLLPPDLRRTIYKRFKDIGKGYDLNVRICGCKNPDLTWEFCGPWVDEVEMNNQVFLFGR